MAALHDVSRELRDPFGRWTKGGSIVGRMTDEAQAARGTPLTHEEATRRISELQPNKKIGLNGHQVAHIPSKGLRVRINGETQHYDNPESAARAVVNSRHEGGTPGPGKAPGPKTPPSGAPNPPRPSPGPGSPGRKAFGPAPKPAVNPKEPGKQAELLRVAAAREISGNRLPQLGYIPNDNEHETLKEGLAAAKRLGLPADIEILSRALAKSNARRRSPAPLSQQVGEHKPGDIVYANGPGLGKFVGYLNGGRSAEVEVRGMKYVVPIAAVSKTTQAEAAHEQFNINDRVQFTYAMRDIHGDVITKTMTGTVQQKTSYGTSHGLVIAGDDGVSYRRSTTEVTQLKAPTPPQRSKVDEEIHNLDIQLIEMHNESGAPLYTARELADTRRMDIRQQLINGEPRIVAKVPSGSEVQMSPEAARQLLGLPQPPRQAAPIPDRSPGTVISEIIAGKSLGRYNSQVLQSALKEASRRDLNKPFMAIAKELRFRGALSDTQIRDIFGEMSPEEQQSRLSSEIRQTAVAADEYAKSHSVDRNLRNAGVHLRAAAAALDNGNHDEAMTRLGQAGRVRGINNVVAQRIGTHAGKLGDIRVQQGTWKPTQKRGSRAYEQKQASREFRIQQYKDLYTQYLNMLADAEPGSQRYKDIQARIDEISRQIRSQQQNNLSVAPGTEPPILGPRSALVQRHVVPSFDQPVTELRVPNFAAPGAKRRLQRSSRRRRAM